MHRLCTAANAVQAQLLQDHLQSHGIEVTVKGAGLQSALGEIPLNTWPELWLADAQQLAAAKALVDAWEQQGEGEDWACNHCGERNGANFGRCWQCGQDA